MEKIFINKRMDNQNMTYFSKRIFFSSKKKKKKEKKEWAKYFKGCFTEEDKTGNKYIKSPWKSSAIRKIKIKTEITMPL